MTAMPPALQASLQRASLPAVVRVEVDLLAAEVEAILSSANRMAAYDAAAARVRGQGHKCTASRMRSLTTRYLKAGRDPFALVDKRKLAHDDNKLPAAFVQEVKRRFQLQGRSAHEAWVQLIADWRRGVPLPGYKSNPPADPYTGWPKGWSYDHLMKVCRTSAFEKVAMRVGLGRARARHGPKHFTTRAGLWPFAFVMLDDVDDDNFIHLLTNSQLCRVSGMGMYEVLSGNYFNHGTQPQLKRIDEKTGREITTRMRESSTRYIVAKFLYEYGFSPRGTTLLGEHGTSTLRSVIVDLLHDRTGGMVRFDAGGWTGKEPAVAGMFSGRGGGNPRHKSAIESIHNLIHNKLASLPGQTGPDVERRPEQLHGLLSESAQLLKLVGKLPPYIAQQLQFPTLEYHTQFIPVRNALIDEMNRRTEHALEGWEKCRFLTSEYRLHAGSSEWLSEAQYLALPPGARATLAQIAQADRACRRPRRLSPHEVFTLGRHETVPAPVALIAELLYVDLVTERKARNSYFEFEDRTIDPDTLRYEARVRTLDGREYELPEDIYEVVVNPFRPDELWVYSGRRGKGSFLGLARRVEGVSRADAQGTARSLARYNERYADQKAPLAVRHVQIARDEARRVSHNTGALAGPRSPEEARVEETRRTYADGDLTELAETEPPSPAADDDNDSISDLI